MRPQTVADEVNVAPFGPVGHQKVQKLGVMFTHPRGVGHGDGVHHVLGDGAPVHDEDVEVGSLQVLVLDGNAGVCSATRQPAVGDGFGFSERLESGFGQVGGVESYGVSFWGFPEKENSFFLMIRFNYCDLEVKAFVMWLGY